MSWSDRLRKLTLTAVATTGLLIATEIAAGQQPPQQRRLGIRGHFEYGYGLVLDSVRWRSAAAGVGLEPGDVIRSIDGRWLRTDEGYGRALQRRGNNVRLIVEDVRTGRLISRSINLRSSPRDGDRHPYR